MFESVPKYRPSLVLMGFYNGSQVFARFNPENGEIEKIVVPTIIAEAVDLFWSVKGDKVRGIKLVRERYSLGLKESKEMVEYIIGQL